MQKRIPSAICNWQSDVQKFPARLKKPSEVIDRPIERAVLHLYKLRLRARGENKRVLRTSIDRCEAGRRDGL